MLILGLGGLGYKDSSAALVRDGRIIAAASEDRFTRQKHAGGYPSEAVDACLHIAGASLADVDHVAVANNPWLGLRDKVLEWYGERFFESPEFRAYHIFHDESHSTLLYLQALEGLRIGREDRFHVVPHHVSHMASSFLAGPAEEAAILEMDGRGEVSTSALGVGRGAEIEVFRVDKMPNSLGLLQSAVADFLGFAGQDDEFRVMSISSEGEARFRDEFREVVRLGDDGSFRLNEAYFLYRDGLAALSQRFNEVFGVPRRAGEPVRQHHRDIAASLQLSIEDAALHAAAHLRERTGLDTLCFAGGVALSWVVNGRLAAESGFRNLYVNPLAGDDGTAVGAALWVYSNSTGKRPEGLASVGLGPAATDAEVSAALRRTGHAHTQIDDPVSAAAELLASGQIVGWCEGRAEFGPRGLGHRAILCDPSNPETRARLLRDVKSRAPHHPFALSITEESAAKVFGGDVRSPYMMLFGRAPDAAREQLAGVLGKDSIVRWHGVSPERDPVFHRLLTAFADRTGGLPALLNTSLNRPGRPPALTTDDALEVFATTGLDAIVIGSHLLQKPAREE